MKQTADEQKAWLSTAANVLDSIRSRKPRVHCITNEVAVTYSANALLAVGATPSMTWQSSEVADFVASASALVINLGTLDPGRLDGMHQAIQAAKTNAIPFVLDPVFVERSSTRLESAVSLIEHGPHIIRGNAAEFDALSSRCRDLKPFANAVRVKSGAIDEVTGKAGKVEVTNGHPMMTQVTATGCAATGLLAACAAVEADSFAAAVASVIILGVAGEMAAEVSTGPGSLQTNLLDALANITGADIAARGSVV